MYPNDFENVNLSPATARAIRNNGAQSTVVLLMYCISQDV